MMRKASTAMYHLFQYGLSFCIIFIRTVILSNSEESHTSNQRCFVPQHDSTFLLNILTPVISN